ncbi:hypothetical protein [Halopiger djelfimassiliensis]|uniref:hypothetical protein n=1 Tax=Halopiger djelfimassiliensis TaxID=1293047 RepID=UPI000677F663|nr:hypothetical protein [Halopiger djelfimassiliensis]
MNASAAKTAVLLVLGIGLLLNPIYLYPDDLTGTGTVSTYDVEPVTNESTAKGVLFRSDRTLKCGTERPCALEREIAENGPVEYEPVVQRRDSKTPYQRAWNRYALIAIDDGYYVPVERSTENGTLLAHRELSTMDALEHIAIPSDRASADVREAIETGSVTLIDRRLPEFESGDPIEHEGEIYRVTGFSSGSGRSGLWLLRLLLGLVGTTCITIAWERRGREATS